MSFTRTIRSLQRYRPQAFRWLTAIAVCAGIAVLYLSGSLLFIDRELSAARFGLLTSEPTGKVVVVAIDPDSLERVPVWPWKRSQHARLIDLLREAGARKIVIDIDFSAESTEEEDAALEAALERAGDRVILPVFEQADANGLVTSTAPLERFRKHTRVASANIYPDADGIVRRLSRVAPWHGNVVPTMSAAAAGLQPSAMGRYYVDFGIAAEVHRGRPEWRSLGAVACFAGIGSGEVVASGSKAVGVSQRRTRGGARFRCIIHARWEPSALLGLVAQERRTPELADRLQRVAAFPNVDAIVERFVSLLP